MLKVGEVLAATVLERLSQNLVRIALGNTVFRAQTPLPLELGQKLQLEVVRGGNLPLLRPLERPPEATQGRELLLRDALPRQQSLAGLLANLRGLARGDQQSLLRQLPPTVIERVLSAYRTMPRADTLSQAAGLRRAVENSGAFFEQRALPMLRALAQHEPSSASPQRVPNTASPAPAQSAPQPAAPRTETPPGPPVLPSKPDTGPLRASLPARPPSPPPQDTARGETVRAPTQLGADFKLNLLRLLTALSAARESLVPPSEPRTPPGNQGNSEPPNAGTPQAPTRSTPTPTPLAPPPMRTTLPQPQAGAEATLNRFTSLPEAVEQLHQQTRAAVARLELSQLASLPEEGTRDPVWLVELPVRHRAGIDLFQLRIERRQGGRGEDGKEQELWSVSLAFDLEPLGPLHARITLCGERVSTLFWAQRENTVARVQASLEKLQERFDQVGLQVERLACRQGTPPAPHPDPPAALVRETA